MSAGCTVSKVERYGVGSFLPLVGLLQMEDHQWQKAPDPITLHG